ncbi:MAG: Asp-tRNA(Asn)/Glu-tRNA(Gln) amidotransferase subunit GatB [Candidatus Omnitrophota bacterium]|nr:MAG: Asp-tRNA(Asn)/Glu-tRNA(Gln) amidotransferase subunit GatB [Candidatus Omnitrophota bacterium]
MQINKELVEYIAHLARIGLSEEELEELSVQLEDILGFIEKLKKIDIGKISPTSHILPINNVFREDEPVESLPLSEVLNNAPLKEGSFFGVPKVIE